MKRPSKREIVRMVEALRQERPNVAADQGGGKTIGKITSKKTNMRIRKQGI